LIAAQVTHVKMEDLAETYGVITTAHVIQVILEKIAVLVRNSSFQILFFSHWNT